MAGTTQLSLRQATLAGVIAPLSYGLDLAEGQPPGHAARSCLIGMRIAELLNLGSDDRSALFYALLLKDAGCSTNATKFCSLFGSDDHELKDNLKAVNWPKLVERVHFLRGQMFPRSSQLERMMKLANMSLQGRNSVRELIEMRCERSAEIAGVLKLPAATSRAIRESEEHWDGRGHPRELSGNEISLLGRISCLAQYVEVFSNKLGSSAALDMIAARSGKWFDPLLVSLVAKAGKDSSFWEQLRCPNPAALAIEIELSEAPRLVDQRMLNSVAEVFGQIVDDKSRWTVGRSRRVAQITVGIAEALELDWLQVRRLRRTALLHDLGMLGVSNLIIDKPGRLTEKEFAVLKRHPQVTQRILASVEAFADQAEIAAAHHERLDGRGYHQGIPTAELPIEARILALAVIYEALTVARPYRHALLPEKVFAILHRDVRTVICPQAMEGLADWLSQKGYDMREAAAVEPSGQPFDSSYSATTAVGDETTARKRS